LYGNNTFTNQSNANTLTELLALTHHACKELYDLFIALMAILVYTHELVTTTNIKSLLIHAPPEGMGIRGGPKIQLA
jgi:hypothetical protein